MPANALCRRLQVLSRVVDQAVFATARWPHGSRHARPVPGEDDQSPHPAALLRRASSRPIGSARISDPLAFRRFEFARRYLGWSNGISAWKECGSRIAVDKISLNRGILARDRS